MLLYCCFSLLIRRMHPLDRVVWVSRLAFAFTICAFGSAKVRDSPCLFIIPRGDSEFGAVRAATIVVYC
jgi:hypothetical protein